MDYRDYNSENISVHRRGGLAALIMQEKDRQRIARDLHDTSLQNLAHLLHKVELCSLYMDREDAAQAKLELSAISKILRKTIDEIRSTIFDLRPMTFDDLGFKAALESLIDNMNEGHKYFFETDIDEISCKNNLILVSAYRIVQECLNNIDKHANAERIFLSCKNHHGKCVITVRDDGEGFDVVKPLEKNHFGLSLMKERTELINGKLRISSEKKKGTCIEIEIPTEN